MRVALFAVIVAGLAAGAGDWTPTYAQPATKLGAKEASTAAGEDTPAADRTRTKLLKVKVSVEFKGTPLREALKEFAAQVDMQTERPVMWTYAESVPVDQLVTYRCSEKPLDKVLDEVFKKLQLGYVVISTDEHPRDGWVRVTQGTERGFGKEPAAVAPPSPPSPPPADDDESKAAARLKLAKTLIDGGKPADAKAMLTLVTTKYPTTKAAAEAKALLEKLTK